MKEKISVYLENNWHILLLGILLFPFYCFFLGNSGFFFKIPLSKWHAAAAFILMIASVYKLSIDKASRISNIAFSIVALSFFMLIGSISNDFMYDSMSYHKTAAYFLADGWNPVWHENLYAYCINNDIPYWQHLSHAHFFPNGQWTMNAICYLISGNINLGDFNNIIWAIAVLVISYQAFTKTWGLSPLWGFAIAFVMASNPVVLSELNCGYIDGLLSCTLIVFLLSCASWIKTGKRYWVYFILISVVFGVNLKFTGLVYFAIAGFVLSLPVIYQFIRYVFNRSTDWLNYRMISFKQWFIVVLIAASSVVLTGMHPYATNTYHYTSPFYFLHSFNPQKYPTQNILPMPGDYGNTNKFQRFWQTYIVGMEDRACQMHITTSKIDLYHGEYSSPFGRIWTIALILTAPIALILINNLDDFLLLLALIATVLIQPHLWMPRFVPQFWYFPFIILAITMGTQQARIKRRISWVLAALLIGIIPMNCYDIAQTITSSITAVQNERNFIDYIQTRQDGYIVAGWGKREDQKLTSILYPIDYFIYYSNRWLNECGCQNNIPYQPDGDLQYAQRAIVHPAQNITLIYCSPTAEKGYKTIAGLQDASKNQNFFDNLAWIAKLRIHQLCNAWKFTKD